MPNSIFTLLRTAQSIHFQARSQHGSQMNWNINGTGSLNIHSLSNRAFITNERFVMSNGSIATDSKHWQHDGQYITFSRHRNGAYEPLFVLCRHTDDIWLSQAPYHCAPDEYYGELHIRPNAVELLIHIDGARKNEDLRYCYHCVSSNNANGA